MYSYDQITFSCLHFVTLLELASQAATNQPIGIFVTDWLLKAHSFWGFRCYVRCV